MTDKKKETKPGNDGNRRRALETRTSASKGTAQLRKKQMEPIADSHANNLLPKDKKGLLQKISILQARLDIQCDELKNALAELESSKDKFRHLYNTTPVGYLTLDRDASVIAVNASAAAMLAMPQRNLTGREFTSLLQPHCQDTFRLAVQKTLKTGEKHSCELEMATSKEAVFSVYLEIAGLPGQGDAMETLRIIMVDITQRKRVEEKLRKSEERYRLLFENTSDGIYIIDRDFNITPLTPNMGKMLGYSFEETKGRKLQDLDFIIPLSTDLAISNLKRVLAGETIPTAEYKFLAKDGTYRYQDISASPLIKDGKVVAAVCVARDITERKLIEETLKKSEDQYRTLVENANEGIAVIQDDAIKFFNAKFMAMTGYDAGEIRTMQFVDLLFPEDKPMVVERHRRRLHGEQINGTYAFRSIHKSGEIKWIEINAALIEWEGKPATLNFFTDITERKKAEEALQKSEEKYRTVVENASEGITIIKEDGSFGYFNNRFLALIGYDASEIRSKRGLEFILPEDRKPLFDRYRRQLKGEKFEDILTCRFMHKSGEIRWLEVNFTLIEWEGKPATLNFQTDITGRKKAEAALQQERDWEKELLNIAGVIIMVLDTEGKVALVNSKACQVLGYSPENIVGKNWTHTFLPESARDMVDSVITRLISGEIEPVEYVENPVLTCNGEERIIAWHNTFIRDENGRISGTLSSGEDITERKQAEKLLAQSEEKYRTLVEHASEGIIISQDGRFKYVNPKLAEISGYSIEELMAVNFINLIHPEDRRLAIQNEIRRLSGEQFENSYPFRAINKQGDIKWIETNSILVDWEGRPATLNFLTDITDRKREEAELEMKALTLDAVADSVFLRNPAGDFIYFNESAYKSRGYTREEFSRMAVKDLDTQERAGEIKARTQAILEKGELVFETVHRCKDGSIKNVEMHSLKVIYGGKDCILTVARDITERKMAERNLEASNQALKKTLDDAVNTIAKIVEIRDPYTAGHQKRVAQLSAAIASRMGLDDALQERLRMAAIIHDIGKIYVPSEILSKPGKLGEIEFGMIKTHPDHGYNIVKSMDLPCSIAQAIQQHHERMDGSGYPAGLKDNEIVQEARILAVADVVEAMASHRPYRPALGINIALEEILKNSGKLYDPHVVDTCLRLFIEEGFKFEE